MKLDNIIKGTKILTSLHLTCGVLILSVLLSSGEAFARRRSVRGVNRGEGSVSWEGSRSSGTSSRSVSGDVSSRSTQVQTKSGETATGTKVVSRSGDEVTVDKYWETSAGGNKSTHKVYEFDDGELETVSRHVSGTDRYGRSADYHGEAKKEGHGWEFEGEGYNRRGQDVEVDGYGARGYYGTGVVADVEGGRFGDRTVVAGKPYGGPAWSTSLPYGSRPYVHHGHTYYSHGNYYYRPYSYGGVHYYSYVPPPYGVYYTSIPVGASVVKVNQVTLYYSEGTYYKTSSLEGQTKYEVVPPPTGTGLPGTELPPGRATVTVGKVTYYYYGNAFYKKVTTKGKKTFVVVTKPEGVVTLKALPPDFEPISVGTVTFFKSKEQYYLLYVDPSGKELFIVVDSPAAASEKVVSPEPTKPAAKPEKVKAQAQEPKIFNFTVSSGTMLRVRLSSDISSAHVHNGQRFQGVLDQDIIQHGRLVIAKGSRISGRVVEAKVTAKDEVKPGLVLEITDIEIGGHIYSVSADPAPLVGTAAGLGTSSLSAGLASILDSKEATPAAQILASEGMTFNFRSSSPFTVAILTSSPSLKE